MEKEKANAMEMAAQEAKEGKKKEKNPQNEICLVSFANIFLNNNNLYNL